MECPNGCQTPIEERKVEKIFHRNNDPIVISDLTIYICTNCGQESMPLSSARIVEDILKGVVKPSGRFNADLYEVSLVK